MKKLRPFLLVAFLLTLPVAGVLGLAAQKQFLVSQSTTVRIPIAGYDPRDLMYGHYLRFRFDGPLAPDRDAHEYFIPEEYANELDSALAKRQNQTIELEVRYSGKRVIGYGMLYINNLPWREYLSLRQKETP